MLVGAVQVSAELVDNLMKEIDADGSGEIDFGEFMEVRHFHCNDSGS